MKTILKDKYRAYRRATTRLRMLTIVKIVGSVCCRVRVRVTQLYPPARAVEL